MNKIIGGLLVATMLARPALLRVDFIAYEVYKAHTQLLAIVRKFEEEQLQVVVEQDIDDILTDIDTNKRHIHRLLCDKNHIYGQIQTAMQLKAIAHAQMTEAQISIYRQFAEDYDREQTHLADRLVAIDEKLEQHTLQKEIARPNTDFDFLYKELKDLSDSQYDAIFNLNHMIELGQQTLAYIG